MSDRVSAGSQDLLVQPRADGPVSKRIPPLAALPFFEAAGRHNGFKGAAEELCVTSAAVGHRIKVLERSLGFRLFERHAHGVRLNQRGEAYLADIQRLLHQLEYINERHRNGEMVRPIKLIAMDALAERWLLPVLSQFSSVFPGVGIDVETDFRESPVSRRDFDLWFAFTDEIADELDAVTLFEEMLVPVCSPAFLEAHGPPKRPEDLLSFPLLYDLSRQGYWTRWFAYYGASAPDLSTAWGFRHYSMLIHAALGGIGIALGYSRLIAPELNDGSLVKVVDSPVTAPGRYVLYSAPGSEARSEIKAFRRWVVELAWGVSGGDACAAS